MQHLLYLTQLGLYGYTVYCATKYALRGLAESLQMEVMPYKVSISISFPPDTETPQLVDERLLRSDIVNQLTSFGTVFPPERIATEVWNGVERKQFHISHGFDGALLATGCCGMSPFTSIWNCVVEVSVLVGKYQCPIWYLFHSLCRCSVPDCAV